jgi:RNA binding exosome subunit
MNVLKNITHATENVNKVMNVLKNITHATENVKCNTWYRKCK